MSWLKEFHGPNAAYVKELYHQYQQDPQSIDPDSRQFFELHSDGTGHLPQAVETLVEAVGMVRDIRDRGHSAALLDPISSAENTDDHFDPDKYGLTDRDLKEMPAAIAIDGPASEKENGWQAVEYLKSVYCSYLGFDFQHLRSRSEIEWLRKAAESGNYSADTESIDWQALLDRLTKVETFEQFLHRIFPGRHRFSIEGLDMLVPILDTIVEQSQASDVRTIMLGMAHRGRLNVMAHVLCRPYKELIAKFKDPLERFHFLDEFSWTGDVKYHQGALRAASQSEGEDNAVRVHLASNPSHVEAVNPVVYGRTRAANSSSQGGGKPRIDPNRALAVLIHGDAGFTGQGVVAETLNLSGSEGFSIGGALHLIANNQIGFTTNPSEYGSTKYASDLARGFGIPVIHVNADKPAACLQAISIAYDYRRQFQKDVVVNLIGYRRYGHNEGDEPAFTQPKLYDEIEQHPTVRELLAEDLVDRGITDGDYPEAVRRRMMQELQEVYEGLEVGDELKLEIPDKPPVPDENTVGTAISQSQLAELNQELIEWPDGFNLHPKLKKVLERRRGLFESDSENKVDWSTAEQLAFGSILANGTAIRMSGEDVERGTFSQRHAVFHDFETGETYTPLQEIASAQATFEIHNSPLTENAVLAYEYGFDIEKKDWLVLWEAQYGDFANGAQVPIDEFISSARAKWGVEPSLVMLLPHGYEGAGPDHSSSRVERYLQLAVENNMRVVNCTTAAQYFHILRLQAALLEEKPAPLVILTPKSLLRHPKVASDPSEFSQGQWQSVLSDHYAGDEDQVRQVLICSGKIAIDLMDHEEFGETNGDLAIIRVERLSPFPRHELAAALEGYAGRERVVWVQEEPENMGPWPMIRSDLNDVLGEPPDYIGRAASSSPAEGSSAWHKQNQGLIVELALGLRQQGNGVAIVKEG